MSLVNELVKGLLPEEEKKQTTAVYAGGFKPPTSGHFEVAKLALEQNPEIDELILFIGNKDRNGISQVESLLIWEIYKKYLPFKVKIEPTSIPPVKAVYDFAKNHPTREVLWVIGAREGNEEDFKDIKDRTKSISKYPNLELRTIVTAGGVSGTAARNAAKVSFEKFEKFVPNILSPEEKQEVYNIVSDKIAEIQTPAKEKEVDPKELKMGIKVEMEHTDDPAKAKVIALQHLAEDPKYYTKLVSLGLEENKQITYTNPNFDAEWEEANRYPEFVEMGKEKWVKLAKQGKSVPYSSIKKVLGNVNLDFDSLEEPKKQRFISAFKVGNIETPIAVKFSNNDYDLVAGNTRLAGSVKNGIDPKIWVVDLSKQTLNESLDPKEFNFSPYIESLTSYMEDNGLKLQPSPEVKFVHDEVENGMKLLGNTAYYTPHNNKIVLFTYGRHPKDILRSYAHELVHVHQNMEDRLEDYGTTNVNQDDRLENIEREAYETGNILFRSWTNSVIEEGKKGDKLGIKAFSQELARLREEEGKYKIYLDMDGVVADFDQRFRSLSGMEPSEFEDKFGKNEFWDFIDVEHKLRFWIGIPVMDGAKELVDYVSKHDYEMLTAPSARKESRLGKRLWIRNHIGDVFPSKPKINFEKSKEKHLIKPELTNFDILIDDKQYIIDNWNNAGGTGILYQSANQVISDLQKLGL